MAQVGQYLSLRPVVTACASYLFQDMLGRYGGRGGGGRACLPWWRLLHGRSVYKLVYKLVSSVCRSVCKQRI
jgi:hypothetical protein